MENGGRGGGGSGGGGRVVGDYVFGRQIGSGSFSVVWAACHRIRGTEVAVKEIVMERLIKKLQDSLPSEIIILKKIAHSNIVALHNIIEASGRIYVVLEYYRGGDLSMYIQRHGRVSEATAKQQLGKPGFTKKQADIFFLPDFTDNFPVAMQISQRYGLIYVITKLGLLFVCDLETATAVYRNRISPDPIFLIADTSTAGGFYAINRRRQVMLATVNESSIIPFVSGQLNNLELEVNLAKRGNLPGEENLLHPIFFFISLSLSLYWAS